MISHAIRFLVLLWMATEIYFFQFCVRFRVDMYSLKPNSPFPSLSLQLLHLSCKPQTMVTFPSRSRWKKPISQRTPNFVPCKGFATQLVKEHKPCIRRPLLSSWPSTLREPLCILSVLYVIVRWLNGFIKMIPSKNLMSQRNIRDTAFCNSTNQTLSKHPAKRKAFGLCTNHMHTTTTTKSSLIKWSRTIFTDKNKQRNFLGHQKMTLSSSVPCRFSNMNWLF